MLPSRPFAATYDAAVSAVLSATGGAVLVIPGPQLRVSRLVTRISLSAAGAATPQAYLYRGPVTTANLIQGTLRGDANTTTVGVRMAPGEFLSVEFRNGTPGSVVTVTYSVEDAAP